MTRDILQDLVRPIWTEQLRRRQEKHVFKMRSINAPSAAKGILRSGAHTWMAFEASVLECRLRALRARKTLHGAVRQTESALTAEDLRSLYLDLAAGSDYTGMNRDIDRLMGEVLDLVPITPKQRGDQMLALAKEQVAAINSEIAELALFAAKPQAMSQPSPGGIVVHGPVYGAVQSGSHSNAHVTVLERCHDSARPVNRACIGKLRSCSQDHSGGECRAHQCRRLLFYPGFDARSWCEGPFGSTGA